MAVDLKKLERLYNNAPSATYQPESTNVQNGIDMDKLTRLYNNAPSPAITTRGQKNSVPVVASGSAIPTTEDAIQQQNYDRMQGFFAKAEQQKDLTAADKIRMSAGAIGRNVVASPIAAASAFWQTTTDPVELEIQALERKADQGILDEAGWQRLAELKPQQYTKELDTSGWSWQQLQKAQQLQEDVSAGFGNTGKFLYNTGMSMATNIATLPANLVVPGASLALMGTQSMAGKALDVAENGGSAGEAFYRGLVSGGIETATEAVSLDALSKAFKGKVGKTLAGKAITSLSNKGKIPPALMAALEQSFSEGGEELVSAIANYAADVAADDPNAQLTAEDLVLSFLGGAISGGVMGAGAYGLGKITNNVKTQANEANRADNEAENTLKRADNTDTLDNNVSRASSEVMKAKVAENPALTAENGTKSSNLDTNIAENKQLSEKEQLKADVAKIMGIDTRTEAEKVAQEQQNKVAMVQDFANKGIAPQSDVVKAQADAQAKIEEANNRQINIDYQKIDTESGAVREKAINSGYSKVVERIEKFASKRQLKVKFFEGDKYVSGFEKDGTIYINVTDPKVMHKTAIHETLHGLRSNNQAEYESLKKAVFDAAGKNKKLFMTGVKAELGYVNSANESVQASIRNEDGTVNRDVVEEEVLAKMCEELIDNPQKFVDKLNGDRTAVQAVIDFVKELIDNVYIEFSDSEKAQMRKAVREAEKALETYMAEKADTSENITKFSVNDNEYLELAKNPEANEAELQKMVDEAAKNAGYTIKAYHGTPNGTFTVFKDWQYFTEDPNYADVYQNQGASSNRYKTTANAPRTYNVYLKTDKAFDTRNSKEEKIFNNEFYRKWGNGAPLSQKGLPDWTDADDLVEFFDENGYDYDAIYIDEGGTGGYGDDVKDRGVSIVIKDSAQIKSADPITYDNNGNVIPLSERFEADNADIRFSVDIDNYTENSYTKSKWVKEYKVVTPREYEDFISKVMSIRTGTHFEKASNGLYMIPTGDEFGVNNTIIFTDGNYNNPSVEKVVHINLDNETAIEKVRDYIYEKEIGKWKYASRVAGNIFSKELFTEHRIEDFRDIHSTSRRTEGSTRTEDSGHNSQQRNGRRNYKEGTGTLKGYRGENLDNYEHNRGVPQITLVDGSRYFITKTGKMWDDLIGMSDKYDTLKEAVEFANKRIKANLSINTDNVQIPAEYEGKTLNEILDLLIKKHGAIEQGEKPAREISVPKKSMDGKKVSKFARTVAEAKATPEDFARNNLLDMAAKGDLSHEVVTDKLALDRAESILRNKGWDDALEEWNALNKTDKAQNKYDIALGQMLYNEAVNNGDTELAQKLVCDLCVQATRAGQTVQAFRLLKKLTPEGKLYMLQKSLDQINREQLERYKSDYKDIEIPTELADKLLKAKDTQTADAAVEEIEQYIADQIPPTIADKFNAWRYLAMLGNPRTHIRNVTGNALFSPFKIGKDILGEKLEKAIVKDGVKTKAKVSKKANPDLWAYAEKDFAQNESAIKGEAKYDGKNGIKEKQRVFDNKYLEKARKFNADWLEKEDIVFLKNHYVRALVGAMKANGITAKTANSLENQKVMAAIKTYATNEAQKATYRDVNAFSKAVQNTKKALNKNSASSVFIEGILPFARTPANVIARGVEYSPIGAVRGAVNLATGGIDTTSVETTIASIKQALKGVKSGKYTTAEALDQLSAGLTGTAICALGFILASIGWAKGKEDDGGKEGDLEKLYGVQDYSLMIGGISYTIDWAAPAAMPFFVGVELYNAFSDTEESSGIVSALLKITDPVFEMSMLDGINNAIEATAYTDTHPIIAMGTSSVLNYAGQAVPTLAGQVARTGNRYRTQTYIDKNKKTAPTLQRFAQQQQAKIPGLNNMLTPYYDQWGRKQDNGNVVGRALQNFASPGYVSTDKSTAVDDEVMRVYNKTKDSAVLPGYADKKFSLDGEYKHLTAKEYETFAKVKGQTSYKIIEELLNNPHYKVLDSDEQADAIVKAYSYAQAKAKEEVSDYKLSKQEKLIDANPAYGVMGTTAFKTEADKDKNGSIKTEEAVAYLNSRNFTVAQKALLFECMCPSVKNNPYK